jgi:hypothetical protein
MEKNKIMESLKNMKENETLIFGRIKVKKVLDFIEKNHGIDNLQYRYYKWEVEQGNEDDKDYDCNYYKCHNDSEVELCVSTVLKGKICY